MNPATFLALMTFWRDVEALSPQQIPKPAPRDQREPVHDLMPGAAPPWSDRAFRQRPVPPDHVWRHTVYAAVGDRGRFIPALERCLGRPPSRPEEKPAGDACVFSLQVDDSGRPLPRSLVISMAAWSWGIVVSRGLSALSRADACNTEGLHTPAGGADMPPTHSGLPGFDAQQDALRSELAWRLGHLPAEQPVDEVWLRDFTALVISQCGLQTLAPATPMQRVKSVLVRRPSLNDEDEDEPDPGGQRPTKPEDDLINSFFIRDIHRVTAGGWDQAGTALRHFLQPPPDMTRTDVRLHKGSALAWLRPHNAPLGCWPAEHPLVRGQQLAVNAIRGSMPQGVDGIFAVNGPPGTGKTTLLRDLVAAVVVERAQVLAAHGRQLFGDKCIWHKPAKGGPRAVSYYPLDERLAGFSMVVASSNNGAVENVSLELPRKEAVPATWAEEAHAFPDLASTLLGKPAWSLVAGRLGSKTRRNAFRDKLWWQKADGAKKVPGLKERLEAIRKGAALPALPWHQAVARFQQAVREEQVWRDRLCAISDLHADIEQLEQQAASVSVEHDSLLAELHNLHNQQVDQAERLADAAAHISRLRRRLDDLRAIKPGWLERLLSLGGATRRWRHDCIELMAQLRLAEDAEPGTRAISQRLAASIATLNVRLQQVDQARSQLAARTAKLHTQLAPARELLGVHAPELDATEATQERASPWMVDGWRAARSRVFIAAMNLHQAFIENNAGAMLANLGVAMDWLSGFAPSAQAHQTALDSLAIACPVVSTTFASAASLFADLGPGSIGWLLIDEAGQAPPQAAVGTIWRAQRVVAVGDPLQLEPVVTLPCTIEAALAGWHNGVDERWHPTQTSVQVLADQATPMGTTLGQGEQAMWLGAPLRVHRRCDDPMFSISNAIAYAGTMVHDKPPELQPWPHSHWIDIRNARSDGNWIGAEGEALGALLHHLLRSQHIAPNELFLVSPFRDVVRELQAIGEQHGLPAERVGTIHTTQGKEAQVVILVLGGGTPGSRDWAAEKPNLLNVAVSRAKARLYVIGDRADWMRRRYFDVLGQRLSPQPVEAARSLFGRSAQSG
jgi:hypothetical protein